MGKGGVKARRGWEMGNAETSNIEHPTFNIQWRKRTRMKREKC
jgi:hypothetical protein